MVRKTNRNKYEIKEKVEELEIKKEQAEIEVDMSGAPAAHNELANIEGKLEALQWVLAKRHEL